MIERWYYGYRIRLDGREVRFHWRHSWTNGWHETCLCRWFVAGSIVLLWWL